MLGAKCIEEELGYLAGMISKHEGMAWFLLAADSKIQEGRDQLRDLLPKKKTELDLRDSQPIQMVKDANIRGFIVRKAYSRDKVKGLAG